MLDNCNYPAFDMGLQQAHPGAGRTLPDRLFGGQEVHSTMRKTTDIQTIDGPRAVSAAAPPAPVVFISLRAGSGIALLISALTGQYVVD